MRKGLIKYVSVILTFTVGISAYFAITFKKPPVDEINQARMAISEAESLHALTYAGIVFRNAKSNYDSALKVWQNENNKLFFLRDFSEVTKYALLSKDLAVTASAKTRSALINIRELLSVQMQNIQKEIDIYEKYYSTVPLDDSQRQNLNRGTMLFKEGMLAFERQNYHAAIEKVDSAEILVLEVTEFARQTLQEYFADYNQWEQSSQKLITSSKKNNTTCIIVDKTGRTCNVYKGGNLEATFSAELGPNWMVNKLYQGDMSTPEGLYNVVSKMSGGETRYYKALLLNYPNEDDKKRFQSNKRNGTIDRNASIGGLIEIHGHGGKGSDWTNGCVALSNRDMDTLYSLCNTGTEVLIIGSLRPLEDILNETETSISK